MPLFRSLLNMKKFRVFSSNLLKVFFHISMSLLPLYILHGEDKNHNRTAYTTHTPRRLKKITVLDYYEKSFMLRVVAHDHPFLVCSPRDSTIEAVSFCFWTVVCYPSVHYGLEFMVYMEFFFMTSAFHISIFPEKKKHFDVTRKSLYQSSYCDFISILLNIVTEERRRSLMNNVRSNVAEK